MEELLERCCGLDVHRDTVVASIMVGYGKATYKETRTFGTMTEDLENLGHWLTEHNIEHVAVESTGIYWKPIFNVLGEGFKITLANARHVRNVPGRKTDVNDSMWLCKLLKNGLIQASFIPPEGIRRLRDFTRYRKTLTNLHNSEKNRLIKLLEAHNYKLATVFTNVFGKSAWNIILMIAAGETDIKVLSSCIDRRVKASRSLIKKALKGTIKKEDLGLLNLIIKRIQEMEKNIEEVDGLIDEALVPYLEEVELLKTIPGVSNVVAAATIAEIGTNMNQFPTAAQLASWAGLCPGNNESAGKKKSTRINPGNKYLKTQLLLSAWSAVRTKDSFWHATFNRLVVRLGRKKAIIAIAHKILMTMHHMLKNKTVYTELGADFVEDRIRAKRISYHRRQLKELGINLELTA